MTGADRQHASWGEVTVGNGCLRWRTRDDLVGNAEAFAALAAGPVGELLGPGLVDLLYALGAAGGTGELDDVISVQDVKVGALAVGHLLELIDGGAVDRRVGDRTAIRVAHPSGLQQQHGGRRQLDWLRHGDPREQVRLGGVRLAVDVDLPAVSGHCDARMVQGRPAAHG
ncbi:MAG TPA: hypothetical protein VFY84_01195 [Jiangellales bacterium]|nr:hypothetical protein [Jiangellales bacterium]